MNMNATPFEHRLALHILAQVLSYNDKNSQISSSSMHSTQPLDTSTALIHNLISPWNSAQAKPSNIGRSNGRDYVANTRSRDPDQLRAVTIHHLRVAALRRVCFVVRELHAQQGRPLLQLLCEVGIVDEAVRSSVECLHPRVASGIPGIHRLDQLRPFISGLDILPVGARRVGAMCRVLKSVDVYLTGEARP